MTTKICNLIEGELLLLKKQQKEFRIKSGEIDKKIIETEKRLCEEMKKNSCIGYSNLRGNFAIKKQFNAKIEDFSLAEPFLRENGLFRELPDMAKLNEIVEKLVEEKKPLPLGINYTEFEKINVKKGFDPIKTLAYLVK